MLTVNIDTSSFVAVSSVTGWLGFSFIAELSTNFGI